MNDHFDGEDCLVQALLCCFSVQAELSIEDGRRKLMTDGAMFANREAPAIKLIRELCEEKFLDPDHDWLRYMHSSSSDPVVGFDIDDLHTYEDANASARRFVVENVYEVLFPEGRGVF